MAFCNSGATSFKLHDSVAMHQFVTFLNRQRLWPKDDGSVKRGKDIRIYLYNSHDGYQLPSLSFYVVPICCRGVNAIVTLKT